MSKLHRKRLRRLVRMRRYARTLQLVMRHAYGLPIKVTLKPNKEWR